MPRTFDVTIDSSATPEEILAAFGDARYWQERLADFSGGTAELTSLTIDANEAVTVVVTVGLLQERLPSVITQLHRGDLEMIRHEKWYRAGDGGVRGDIAVSISGAPISATGQARVAPAGGGSSMTYAATVAVRIPLVGGKIESFVGGLTIDEIKRLQQFTTEWVAAAR